jgi:hypothetical protein
MEVSSTPPMNVLLGRVYEVFNGDEARVDSMYSSGSRGFRATPIFCLLGRLVSLARAVARALRGRLASRTAGQRPSRVFDLAKLPPVLEYTGEFGPELVLFLPFCTWLSNAGLLKNRRVLTYRGMRGFYDDLDCLEILEKDQPRTWIRPDRRAAWLPVANEHDFDGVGKPDRHTYPDLRAKFSRFPLIPDLDVREKPLLIVHNKHNDEWNSGPVNHLPLQTLEAIFSTLESSYTIVYIRHGMGRRYADFSDDHNTTQPFDESGVLAAHPDVLTFDNLYHRHGELGGVQDMNTFKNVLYSRCFRFITSQGGGAHHIAMFAGSLLVVLHRRGFEERWAYGDGYYGFMADAPPTRVICRTDADLVSALPIFAGTTMAEGRVVVDLASADILARFSPWTIAARPVTASPAPGVRATTRG